jgi:hypothetical protein
MFIARLWPIPRLVSALHEIRATRMRAAGRLERSAGRSRPLRAKQNNVRCKFKALRVTTERALHHLCVSN